MANQFICNIHCEKRPSSEDKQKKRQKHQDTKMVSGQRKIEEVLWTDICELRAQRDCLAASFKEGGGSVLPKTLQKV